MGGLLIRCWESKSQVNRGYEAGCKFIHLLRLSNFHFCHGVLAIPGIADFKFWITTLVFPLLEKLLQAASCYFLQCALKIGGDHFTLTLAFEIGMDGASKCRVAQLVEQHMKDPVAPNVPAPVKKFKTMPMIGIKN